MTNETREQAEQLAEAFADEYVMGRAVEAIHAALLETRRKALEWAIEAMKTYRGNDWVAREMADCFRALSDPKPTEEG